MLSFQRATRLSSVVKAQLGEIILLQQKRNIGHVQRYGEGGRNSFNGKVVTVFGGTGFLGRYVINRLARSGTQIIAPYRGTEDDVRDLRLMGDLGQIVFMPFDIKDYESIKKTMTHSSVAINLIGKNWTNWNYTIQDTAIDGAESIAKAATECGVKDLIHMSHLMAGDDSPSEFMRAKASGEKVAASAFPNITIMKPAEMIGDEDRYINKYAYFKHSLIGIPLVKGGWETIKRPVFVVDVAQAVVKAALEKGYSGKTYELYGPESYFLHDIVDFTMRVIRTPWRCLPVPMKLYQLIGWAGEWFVWAPKVTRDMIVREFITEEVNEDAHTFEDLGITPVNINDAALPILRRHRSYYHWSHKKDEGNVCRPASVMTADA